MRIYTLPIAIIAYCAVTAFTPSKSLQVTSSAFTNNGNIPTKYTCMGAEFSPPISIKNVPAEAKSFVIIVDDPDATKKVTQQKVCIRNSSKGKKGKQATRKPVPTHETVQVNDCFTHWVIWNIGVENFNIPENFKNDNEGMNGSNEKGYKAICPPSGLHHYHFKVYALDTKLNIPKNSTKAALEKVMQGHILSWGELVGVFNKDYK